MKFSFKRFILWIITVILLVPVAFAAVAAAAFTSAIWYPVFFDRPTYSQGDCDFIFDAGKAQGCDIGRENFGVFLENYDDWPNFHGDGMSYVKISLKSDVSERVKKENSVWTRGDRLTDLQRRSVEFANAKPFDEFKEYAASDRFYYIFKFIRVYGFSGSVCDASLIAYDSKENAVYYIRQSI